MAQQRTSSTSGLWRDLKTLVACEIAKMDEKFSVVFDKLSAVEARIERLEAGLQPPQTSKPGTSTEFPLKRKRRTQLSLCVLIMFQCYPPYNLLASNYVERCP